ncbi:transcriptional regulatory protein SIN3 [Trichoderma asperellum]|uniref:Transcriptional regulatory protein SIN3 n=1 Tax=Trichoderma asperellum TaxID=101201 RepID=A0A6V8QTV5_TRIAP|nr:transcriptional regulatory protein SIN3 [Trichoderma asperellum]
MEEESGERMNHEEERSEENTRHLARKQKRREEKESRRLEDEAQRQRLADRFDIPSPQVTARGSRRRSGVYEDGYVYRLDDSPERTQDNKVKDHFQDKPEVYEQFIEIFQNIKEQQAPLQDAYAEITTLFNSAPDLLEDFKQFLPDSKGQAPRGQIQNEHRAKGSVNTDQFMENLKGFMHEKGLPLDPNPMIGGKPISLVTLFLAVQAKGGFKTLNDGNGWSSVAQILGFRAQNPNVVVALRQIYEQNLLKFEAWVALQEVDLETILRTAEKQVTPGQARASLGHPEEGTAAGSDYIPQPHESDHTESPTEPAHDVTLLQEYAEAEEEKDQIEAEMHNFKVAFRVLRHEVKKQEVLEIEEAQGIYEARDLARGMEILKSEVEALEDQYAEEAPRGEKIEIARELRYKMRSLNLKYLKETIEEIQANRKKRQELIVEGKVADSSITKAAAAKKKTEEVEEPDTKTLTDPTAPVKAVNMKINESAKSGETEPAPIMFKDAVGRKFSFPFHLCNTWQAMEELIKQAFLHVDVLGPHVQEGHYDIIGPNGEIILPSIWEKVIEPGWAVTMTMWPLDKPFEDPGRLAMSQKPEDPPPYLYPGFRRLSPKEPGHRGRGVAQEEKRY